jgi:hypothetical protein
MPKQQSSFVPRLSFVLISLGWIYLALNLIGFLFFAPLKTRIAGTRISFTTLNNPLMISLLLFLLGLLFRYLDRRRSGFSQSHILAAIFCFVYLIYLNSGVMTSFDSRWTLPTARSIITQGNADLDEYRDEIGGKDYRVENIDGHLYSVFPIGAAVASLPFIWIFNDEVVRETYPDIERLIASLFMATAAVFIYLIAARTTGNRKMSLLLVFVFACCTSVWSTASRALWQHGPSILMLAISLDLVILAKTRPAVVQYVGLPLVFSFIVRPTNSISIGLLTLFILLEHRRYFIRYLTWSFLLALPFFLYNFSVYHSILSPYYLPQRAGSFQNFLPALAGHLLSPSRGLFIFSPVLLFSICGLFWKAGKKALERLDVFILAIIVLHWLTISSFAHWWAGHSYGPRFFADVIPYLIYLLIPGVAGLSALKGLKKRICAAVFVLLMAMSFLIHMRGATTQAVYEWNYRPVSVDKAPERIWDWHDPQFLRGLI